MSYLRIKAHGTPERLVALTNPSRSAIIMAHYLGV